MYGIPRVLLFLEVIEKVGLIDLLGASLDRRRQCVKCTHGEHMEAVGVGLIPLLASTGVDPAEVVRNTVQVVNVIAELGVILVYV